MAFDYQSATVRHLADAPKITWDTNTSYAYRPSLKKTEIDELEKAALEDDYIRQCVTKTVNFIIDAAPHLTVLLDDGLPERLYKVLAQRVDLTTIHSEDPNQLLDKCLMEILCHTEALQLAYDRMFYYLKLIQFPETMLPTALVILHVLFLDCIGTTAVNISEQNISNIQNLLYQFRKTIDATVLT